MFRRYQKDRKELTRNKMKDYEKLHEAEDFLFIGPHKIEIMLKEDDRVCRTFIFIEYRMGFSCIVIYA
jgi:hypothetical protein